MTQCNQSIKTTFYLRHILALLKLFKKLKKIYVKNQKITLIFKT